MRARASRRITLNPNAHWVYSMRATVSTFNAQVTDLRMHSMLNASQVTDCCMYSMLKSEPAHVYSIQYFNANCIVCAVWGRGGE